MDVLKLRILIKILTFNIGCTISLELISEGKYHHKDINSRQKVKVKESFSCFRVKPFYLYLLLAA